MGGGSSHTNIAETNIKNEQQTNTYDNTANIKNNWDVTHSTTKVHAGNTAFGNSVELTNSANTGTRCMGMSFEECKQMQGLQNLGLSYNKPKFVGSVKGGSMTIGKLPPQYRLILL